MTPNMAAGITSTIWTMRACWRREVKTKTRIRLLAMSKVGREKRLDELNQKLGITHPDKLTECDQEEMEEREWLKKKLGYEQH
jgi:hypothetical protein